MDRFHSATAQRVTDYRHYYAAPGGLASGMYRCNVGDALAQPNTATAKIWQDLHPRTQKTNAPSATLLDTMDALSDQLHAIGLNSPIAVEPTRIRQRLAAVGMGVETLVDAIAIAQAPDHPLWSKRHASAAQANLILRDLMAVIRPKGWRVSKRQAIQRGCNNPYRIIAYLWNDLLR